MSFSAWKALIHKAGVDLNGVDNNWLIQQFQMGVSPGQTAQAINLARKTPARLVPPVQFVSQRQLTTPTALTSKHVWYLIGLIVCLLVVIQISINTSHGDNVSNENKEVERTANAPLPNQENSLMPSNSAKASESEQKDEAFASRWRDISKIFEDQGSYVEPWDADAPYTMRVHLPSRVAMDLSSFQAREMAGMARSRLDKRAIVYIKSEGGQTLAKAAPWGIE